MYKFFAIVCTAFMVCTGLARAAGSGPSTHTRTLNITGTSAAATSADVDPLTGACNFDSWVDQCPDTNCDCIQVTVSTASGSLDKGSQSVSNFFVTTTDINAATEPAVDSGPDPECAPFRAVLTDTTSTESKTLNALGVSCKKVIAISNSNPQGKNVGSTLVGGWGISNDPAPSPDASGWGTFSGSTTKSNHAVSSKLSGLVTE